MIIGDKRIFLSIHRAHMVKLVVFITCQYLCNWFCLVLGCPTAPPCGRINTNFGRALGSRFAHPRGWCERMPYLWNSGGQFLSPLGARDATSIVSTRRPGGSSTPESTSVENLTNTRYALETWAVGCGRFWIQTIGEGRRQQAHQSRPY